MFRTTTLALAFAAVAVVSPPAAAQGFSFSYGIGDPYSDPYYRPMYRRYPPRYYAPPVVVVPAPAARGTVRVPSPGEVEADLRANGFSRLSPIEASGDVYQLTAVDPGGNLVALTISIVSGRIEQVEIIEARYKREVVPEPAPAPARRAAPATPKPAAPKVAAAPKPAPPKVAAAPRPKPQAAPAAAAAAPPPVADRRPAPEPEPLPKAEADSADERDPLVVY